jgi:hypothetical protein
MDGTLVDSTAGVVGAWTTFAKAYPGIDVHEILSCEDHFYLFYNPYLILMAYFQAHTACAPWTIFANIVT